MGRTYHVKLLFRQQYELRLVALRLVRRLRSAIRVETMQNRLLDTLYREGVITEASCTCATPTIWPFGWWVTVASRPPPRSQHSVTPRSSKNFAASATILMEDLTYRGEEFPLHNPGRPGLQRTTSATKKPSPFLNPWVLWW